MRYALRIGQPVREGPVGSFRTLVAIVVALVCLATGNAKAEPPTEKLATVPQDLEKVLMQGDFDKLDDLASDYRSTRIRTTGGYWALGAFYDIVSAFAGAGCGCFRDVSSVPFDAKRKQLELWLASKPQSSTARIALADMWKNYAWMRRGGDYAGKVSDSQWRAITRA